MALVTINDTTLKDIADAIRDRNFSEDAMTPARMAEEIYNLPEAGSFSPMELGSIDITENGEYYAVDYEDIVGFASVNVNVPTGGGYDMAALNYVEISAPSKYSNYSKLPDLTPYVDNIDKIVAMAWCGDSYGSLYVYFRGIQGYRIFYLKDVYGLSSSNTPQFVTPTNYTSNYYWIDGDLSGLNVKSYSGGSSTTMSYAFANGLVMLYED